MLIELTLGQATDPSPISVPGEHEGNHLMDLRVHPYGDDLYSSEPGFALRHPPAPGDLYRRYGDTKTGTPYHSDQAYQDIATVAKYNRERLGKGWVNERGEVLAEGVYDACFTQAAGQPGALIREAAIALRREREGKESPPEPLFTDLQSFFALRRRQLPWMTSATLLPPQFSATPELRLLVYRWYRYQIQKAIDAGLIAPGLAAPAPFSGKPTGPVGFDVNVDGQTFLAIWDAWAVSN